MVQNNMARKVKFSRLYASHTYTPSFHNVTRPSSNGARYTSISFPGCFGPWISSDIKMYFRFIHSQGGRLYIHRFTGQVLCRLLMLPKGFIPSVLNPKEARLLRWHSEERKRDGKLRHCRDPKFRFWTLCV